MKAALLLFLGLGLFQPAVASSYTLLGVGGDNYNRVYGIDDYHHIFVTYLNCSGDFDVCYREYSFSPSGLTYVGSTTTRPSVSLIPLASPNPCPPPPSGFHQSNVGYVCENGFVAMSGSYDDPSLCDGSATNPFCYNGGYVQGVWLGTDLIADHISGSMDAASMNDYGDLLYDNGAYDLLVLAVNLDPPTLPIPTPEPSTLCECATGLLAVVLRRRMA